MREYLKILLQIMYVGVFTCFILNFSGCFGQSERAWPSHQFLIEVINNGSQSHNEKNKNSNSSAVITKVINGYKTKEHSINLLNEFSDFLNERNLTATLSLNNTEELKENSTLKKYKFTNSSKMFPQPQPKIKVASSIVMAGAEIPFKTMLKNEANKENTKFFIKDSTESYHHSSKWPLYGSENFPSITSKPFVSLNFANKNTNKYETSSIPFLGSIKEPQNFKAVPLKKYTTQIFSSATPTSFKVSTAPEINPHNKIPVRLILTDPSSVKVKLKGSPSVNPQSEENFEVTKEKSVLFKIWKFHEGSLRLEFEQFVPHELIKDFKYSYGDILNLNQVPLVIKHMIEEQSERTNRRVGNWEKLSNLNDDSSDQEENINVKSKQVLLNYVIMDSDEYNKDPKKNYNEDIIDRLLNDLQRQPNMTAADRFSVMNQVPLNLYNQDAQMTTKDYELITTLLVSLLKEKNDKAQTSVSSENYQNLRPVLSHFTTSIPNHHVTQHPLVLSYPPIYSQFPNNFPHQYPTTPYGQLPIFPSTPTPQVKPVRTSNKKSNVSPEVLDESSEDYDDVAYNTKSSKGSKKRKKKAKKKTNKLLKLFDIDKFNFNFDFGFDVFSLLQKALALKLVPLVLIMISSLIPLLPLFWKFLKIKKIFKSEKEPNHLHQYYYPIYSVGNQGWGWENENFNVKNYNYASAANSPSPFYTTFKAFNSKSSTESSSENSSPFRQTTPTMLELNNPNVTKGKISTVNNGNIDTGQLSQESLKFDYWKPFLPDGVQPGDYRDSLSKTKGALFNEGFKIGTKLGNLASKENVEALQIILEDKKEKVKNLLNKYNLGHLNLPALIGRKEDVLTTEPSLIHL